MQRFKNHFQRGHLSIAYEMDPTKMMEMLLILPELNHCGNAIDAILCEFVMLSHEIEVPYAKLERLFKLK